MIRIFFVGNLKVPFMQQDKNILMEDNEVITYDMAPFFRMGKSWNIRHPINVLYHAKEIKDSDIIWCWIADYHLLPFLVLAKLFRKPFLVHIGGWEVDNSPEINNGCQLRPIRGWVARQIIRCSTRCMVPSESYKKICLDLVPECKPAVVPNFIDADLYNAPLPEKELLCVTALCSMQASNVKGIPIFKQAGEILKPEGITSKVINGIKRADYINTLKKAKVYCQLSYSESFGISLVEAMALGCVPVVSDRNALPRIIQDTGIVVPYGDAITTAKAIKKAMTMDGTAARERARYFSRDRKKAAVTKLIQGVLK